MDALTVIKAYESLFQDEHGNWLACERIFNISNCRCLDSIQLDIGLLLLNSPNAVPKVTFDYANHPYIVNFYKDCRVAESTSITWCSDSDKLKMVSPLGLSKCTLFDFFKLQNSFYLTAENLAVIFVLLCLYKANTSIQREDLVEFYLKMNPQAFGVYIDELLHYITAKKKYRYCM